MEYTKTFKFVDDKVILRVRDRVCDSTEELLSSEIFFEVTRRFVEDLKHKQSPLLQVFDKPLEKIDEADIRQLVQVFLVLSKMNLAAVPKLIEDSERFVAHKTILMELVESLYNFWREYDRLIVCDSTGDNLDQRPYRTFNKTIESLMHLVRQVYRDVQENISGIHPNIYRQIHAGAEVAVIAMLKEVILPEGSYQKLCDVSVIRQLLLYPPLLLNPRTNKRSGIFQCVDQNPLDLIDVETGEWLCYPAKVGSLLIMVYVHEKFFDLGMSLCNLFELADDEFLERPVDAIFLYGVPGNVLDNLAPMPVVFYDDLEQNMVVGACPNKEQFGYFGYLKKMVLTLHNIKMMKQGRLPFHGAMTRIVTKDDHAATILIIGDTGTGKSETLEALRAIAEEQIKEIIVIADDMGSLSINAEGRVVGYGSEVGAFVRLDDLQPGYAFGQLDRAIIMNPNQVNARVVLPVTTYDQIMKGYAVEMVLYANNYEQIDDDHPIIEQLNSVETALQVFREGTAMSKGTTTTTGLMHNYFVNVFGAIQYQSEHEQIAQRYFERLFQNKVFIGQLRTQLGVEGWERKGPEEAARALLEKISLR
jgi:energy-coupling factor transporter ATP-binding protein EcfA2